MTAAIPESPPDRKAASAAATAAGVPMSGAGRDFDSGAALRYNAGGAARSLKETP